MNEYDNILFLAHHTSAHHPRMSEEARAAQFAPFAALTGLEEELAHRARVTVERVELDEGQIALLNQRLTFFVDHPEIPFLLTYFRPDPEREGGEYLTVRTKLCRVDTVGGTLVLSCAMTVPIDQIYNIEELCDESEE